MNSKERVIAALNHQEPDRIPWGEHSIDYNIYEMLLGRESFVHAKFKEMKAYWEGRRNEVIESYKRDIVDLTRMLDMDIITLTPVVPDWYHPDAYKQINEDTYEDSAGGIYRLSSVTGDLMKIPINSSYIQYEITLEQVQDMIDALKSQPELDLNTDISEYEVINHVVKELGETHFIICAINGIEWARFGINEEEGWMNILLEPEICEKIAEYQYILTVRELKRLKATGIDGVLSVGDLGHTNSLAASPESYRSIIYKYHQQIYAECKKLDLYVLRHCCGHVWPIIDEICECNDAYEGIQAFAGMDIKDLKNAVGDKICLWGGILHEHIHGGTTDDIRADAIYSFKNAAPGGGFIMGSSHSLTIGATIENIMEMKKCRDELGTYPIKI